VFLIWWIYEGQTVLAEEQIWTLPVGLLFAATLVGIGRKFILTIIYGRWLRRHYRRQVAIIGSNQAAQEIASMVIENNAPFWVAGTIGGDHCLDTSVPKDRLGDIIELPNIAKKNRLSEILVTEEKMDRRTLISLLDFGLSNGITIWFTPALLPIIDRKIYIDNFCGIPMIKMCSLKRVALFNRMKYALDASVALPLFVALLPLFGVIGLAIKINSKGPVFYRARAIGKNGVEFKMFKFRSMRVNNDACIHKEFVTKLIKGEIGQKTDGDCPKPLKITNDPRITWIGGLLRKYSLDELPQLINVLLGQMSLIGPRPCLPYEFDVYQDWYKKRAAIRPGITGLWQVAGRSEVAFEEMILLDLYYLYNRSLWMDINLVIETVFVVLSKKGAY
jgi:exopolysaccharide biosynthesis polyprenyl glycosylphosphotransferase